MGTNYYMIDPNRRWGLFFDALGIEKEEDRGVLKDFLLDRSACADALPPRLDFHSGDWKTHIGKSSVGWCFSVCIHPEFGIHTWEDWICRLSEPGVFIEDEDGGIHSLKDFRKVVEERSFPRPHGERGNPRRARGLGGQSRGPYEIDGPNNLSRHRIDGQFCVGHGSGTWDLIQGTFS